MGFTGRRMWQPFDVKFKSAIERLDQHRQIFDQEMVIQDEMILTNLQHGQKALQQQLGKLQMSLSDTMLKKILEDIVDSERTLTGYYATLKESITPRGITDMRASFNKGKEQLLPWYEALRKSMDSSARGTTIPEEELIELAARRAREFPNPSAKCVH
jgi:hypothetical protein